MLNAQGYGVNSMHQYYWDASHGQLHVWSEIFPIPPGSTVLSYQSPHPRSYFMPYSATNPNGYSGSNDRRFREHALLRDAIAEIHDQIPSHLMLDADNDGLVDHVNFLIRGAPTAWATLLWPHAWALYSYDVMIHGKRVWTYNFNMETSTNSSGVGVLAHEFGHSLGLPDFYRYNTSGYAPTGMWDLMAADRNPPQSITAHAQQKYLNWIPPIPIITQSGTYTLNPLSYSTENVAFRINSPYTNSEYFVVEYRNDSLGIIDSTLPGTGLLVYRINPSLGGNSEGDEVGDEVYIYRPNGSLSNDGSLGSAYFAADALRTAINDLTNPNSFLQNGQPGGLFLYNVGSPGETISFDVLIGGANPNDFNESFENQIFTEYDWLMDKEAPWYITDQHASHGIYSATSPHIENEQSARLQTSLVVDSGYIQFFIKTSTLQNGDFLKFLINNQEIRRWSGENDWTHFSMPILADTYNFAWVFERGASGFGGEDKVWIDQIGFPEIIGHVLYPPLDLTPTLNGRDITFNWDEPFISNLENAPDFLGYNIYQNGIQLNSDLIQVTTFTINNLTGGNMQFWVDASYETGLSPRSNYIAVALPFLTPINVTARNEGYGVRINWDFPVESHTLAAFRVFRNGQVISVPNIAANVFTYHDTNVTEGETYTYHVRAVFLNPGGQSDPSDEVTIDFVDIDDETPIIYTTQLQGNYPNPFNPETLILFELADQSHVILEIFNIRGALVRTLINEDFPRGNHSVIWNGEDTHGNMTASGVYFYKMTAGDFQTVRRMVLLK
ncbi:MAG: M6 family metalloprotease domain-containing protein [Candidatus Cloacimonetes bacterium]|nr:M6 family metalloprotease domain-containing protein [Candidatus Cloacimonadota bacterium]